jgi:hypothetical protein
VTTQLTLIPVNLIEPIPTPHSWSPRFRCQLCGLLSMTASGLSDHGGYTDRGFVLCAAMTEAERAPRLEWNRSRQ